MYIRPRLATGERKRRFTSKTKDQLRFHLQFPCIPPLGISNKKTKKTCPENPEDYGPTWNITFINLTKHHISETG